MALGCGIVALIVVAAAGVTFALFYRSIAKHGVESVETGMALAAKVQLQQAARSEQTYFAQNERFSDDPETMKRANATLIWVHGTEVSNRDEIAVLDCQGGVLIQKKVTETRYFAEFLPLGNQSPFYLADRQPECPEIDTEGRLPNGWSPTDDVYGAKPGGASSGAPAEPPNPAGEQPGVGPGKVPKVPTAPAGGGGGTEIAPN